MNDLKSDSDMPGILLVDDIPDNLKIMGNILRNEGYNVRQVLSGALALQVAELEIPDLILLDIMMPGMDGYEVCRRLKENPKLKDIPVIFISALNDTSDIVRALKTGGVDYINKPFKAEEVKARVHTHLIIYRQNKELKELNATKDKFFSIIAHDLRNPFTGFLGLTKMMQEEIKLLSTNEIEDMVGLLNTSANDLMSLLENLLEWAKMQRGITSFNPVQFLLTGSILNCIKHSSDSVRKKEITTKINIPADLKAFADIQMFETVLRNLFSNAVKFTPKGGKVTVSARKENNNFLEVAVSDTGIGMNNDLKDKLFQISEKTGRQGTEGEPSSGLGLIICKDFIEKHGGKIWVESEEGKGTTFYFNLPPAS
jgi:signal transduction histidine kinase